MARQPDLVVSIAPPGSPSDRRVAVVGDYVVDITGATDGQVLTIQPDGSVAAEDPFDLDAMRFKGVIDASTNPNYPAGNAGDLYRISVAGKIGGASGVNVEIGDLVFAIADNAGGTQAAVGASWSVEQANIDGAVVGPAAATADNFATYNGTTGKLIKDSGLSFDNATVATGSALRIPSQSAVKAYTDAAQAAAQAASVPLTLYDANTLLIANVDNTPLALTVGASTIVGRKAAGGIAAMTAAETKAVLAIAESDVTGLTADLAALVPKSLYDANTILAATVDDTPAALTIGASTIVGRKAAGGISAMTPAETKAVLAIAESDVTNLVGDLALKAPLASPALTGNPTAPTQAAGDNSTRLATTAYANALVADAITDGVLAIAPSQNAVFDALALKAPSLSPTFSGTPLAPTAVQGTNTTQIATTAMVQSEVTLLAPKASPTFTGTVVLPAATASGLITANAGVTYGSGQALTLNAGNIVTDTTTGTKIGTATTQKLGFFNATPVVQEAGSNDVLASLVTLGLRAASSNPPLNLGTGTITAGNHQAGSQMTVGTTNANIVRFTTNNAIRLTIGSAGGLTFGDGTADFTLGTTTGSKIGTATNEKLAFHNSTPVIQRANAAQAAVVTTGSALASFGYTQAQADAIVALVNELRAAMVEKGLIKGSA